MKKHIDWKRVGIMSAFLLPAGAFPIFIYRIVTQDTFNVWIDWYISLGISAVFTIVIIMYTIIFSPFKEDFYHNGEEKLE